MTRGISVFTVAAFSHVVKGVELHINRRPLAEWLKTLGVPLEVVKIL